MGNAKIWYYPTPGGTVEEIDLGEGLSDLQVETRTDQAVAEGISGMQATSQYSARATVRVIDERFTSASLHRKLYALREHLRRGGLCAIAEDCDKAWAAFAATIPVRTSSSVTIAANAVPWPYDDAPSLASGEEVEILGSQPLGLRCFTTTGSTISGNAATNVTMAGVTFDFVEAGARWVLLRQRGFWPLLRMPISERNQPMITDDHRISYTLDVVLEEAIDQYEVWAEQPTVTVQTTTVTGTRRTIEQPTQEPIEGLGAGWRAW